MTHLPYRREDNPPPAGPKLKLFRLKAGESANFALLGQKVHGVWTHWNGRTDPCIEPKELCNGCAKQHPQRWKGYIFARHESTLELGFLEVTQAMREKLIALLNGEQWMRGSRVKALRGNGQKTSVQYLLLRPWLQEHEGQPMPDDVSPMETLRVLFEWRRPKSDGKNGPP